MLHTVPFRVRCIYKDMCRHMLLYSFKFGLDPTPVFVSEWERQEVQFRILPLDGRVSDNSRPCSRLFNTDKNVQ